MTLDATSDSSSWYRRFMLFLNDKVVGKELGYKGDGFTGLQVRLSHTTKEPCVEILFLSASYPGHTFGCSMNAYDPEIHPESWANIVLGNLEEHLMSPVVPDGSAKTVTWV